MGCVDAEEVSDVWGRGFHGAPSAGFPIYLRFAVLLKYHVTDYFLATEHNMSRKELVFVVSRTFALILISWAIVDISYLPERLFALTHHVNQGSVLVRYDYWSSYYLVVTGFLVARVLALLLVAGSFWRCGPRVQALFSPEEDNRGV